MSRRDELLKCFKSVSEDNKTVIEKLIDVALDLESQIDEIKGLPKYVTHPKHPDIIKPTPAFKMQKELIQQYNNTIKTLSSYLKKEEGGEESPLRAYLRGSV